MSTHTDIVAELTEQIRAWSDAIVSNEVDRIDAFVAPEWVLVTPEAGVIDRERFLDAVASGLLRHDTMSHDVLRVHTLAGSEAAVVTTRGHNTGTFLGTPLQADEWTTDVFERHDGTWRCVLTQLTPVSDQTSS